ncbi:MAG: M48 family metallopeptidase [Mariprofundaceae bacterium]|nr:M48 family metallopeptidase [Mariprofundaceae bacterium]
MPSITGFYYPSGSSKKHEAIMRYDDGLCRLYVDEEEVVCAQLDDIHISERLGQMPRQLRFSDGEMFETTDNAPIDDILKSDKPQAFAALLHRLESKSIYIFPLFFAAAFILWGSYTWGLPKIVHIVTYAIPASQLSHIGDETLVMLDKIILDPSELDQKTQDKIQIRFQKLTAELGSGFDYQLLFRRIPDNLPNAFALPNGTIIMMDGLVDLAENPWEVDSVLLHELAHVEERHSLQMVLRNTAIPLFISLMLGDAVSTGNAIASLPVLFLENNYSQKFEQSSDDYASDYMLRHHVDTIHFSNMLHKLELAYLEEEEQKKKDDDSIWDYFSTHPKIEDRIQRIKENIIRHPQS